MHPEARAGLAKMLADTGLALDEEWEVLDLGGRDINGGIRDLLPNANWTGVDVVAGPGVDLVHDCTRPWPADLPKFDVVVCTEVLEHVAAWRELVKVCGQALKPDGARTVYLTCASTGRRPHGASGALNPAPGEWYRNVSWQELSDELETLYRHHGVTYNPNPGDLYAWASELKPTC